MDTARAECIMAHMPMNDLLLADNICLFHWSQSVAYLCKMAPMAKFKYAPILIIQILDIGTIFLKNKK